MHTPKHPTATDKAPDVQVSRRHLILLGASTLTLLASASCMKKEPSSCTDVSGLSPAEVGVRTSLEYQDHSPHPDKRCDNCMQYTVAPAADQCGGCKVMKGPIHPKGYCKVWAQKT
jgi:hypothetical protein